MEKSDQPQENFDWEATWKELDSGCNQIREKGLAGSTQHAVTDFRKWWSMFNKDVLSQRYQRTAEDAFELAGAAELKLYLIYRLKNSRSIKQGQKIRRSTVQSYYKTLQMVYFLDTARQLPRATNDTLNKFIESHLTSKFDLVMESKDKPTCSVTDLFNLLHYHWCQDVDSGCHGRYRVQVAFLMQLIAYTSSRPGSIIEANCYKGRGQVLKYKDMNLSLLRNHLEGGTILVLEVTTTFLKGKRNKREPVTYVLYERRDNPIFCPIMNILALAFADDAFMEGGIQRPEDLYSLEIPTFKETLSIQWKPEILETPIFRRQKGDEICETTPLGFSDFSYYLKKLGVQSGYPQVLTSYVLRRGAASAVDCPQVTDVQRNQIMGHATADVFRRHYLHQTVKVDTQSQYLGTINRDDLIKNIGLMSAKRDPRAPVKINPQDLTLEEHPEIATLLRERDELGNSIKTAYKTITASKTLHPDLYNKYVRLRNEVNSRKVRLKRAALEQSRKEWFEEVDHKEISQQLRGEAPSVFTYSKPDFDCPLRSLIAEHYTCAKESTWADTVRALASLCQQKPPIHTKEATGDNKCPFCFCDEKLRLSDRSHSFHTVNTLRRHISRRHAACTASLEPVICPFQQCGFELDNGEHLKNHFASMHDLNL